MADSLWTLQTASTSPGQAEGHVNQEIKVDVQRGLCARRGGGVRARRLQAWGLMNLLPSCLFHLQNNSKASDTYCSGTEELRLMQQLTPRPLAWTCAFLFPELVLHALKHLLLLYLAGPAPPPPSPGGAF